MREKRRAEIKAYAQELIAAIMEWYIQGDAVVCADTQRAINRDLDSVFPELERKFNLRKIPKVLRARYEGDGIYVVRVEDPYLN